MAFLKSGAFRPRQLWITAWATAAVSPQSLTAATGISRRPAHELECTSTAASGRHLLVQNFPILALPGNILLWHSARQPSIIPLTLHGSVVAVEAGIGAARSGRGTGARRCGNSGFRGAASLRRTSLLLASTALPGFAFAEDTPKKGGRLTVAADSEPRNLNPAIVASNGVFFVVEQGRRAAGRSLLRRRRTGSTPRLATAWEGSDDGLTVTFKLRDGVNWHDGKPFTSADVAFSALEVWKPLQNLGRVVFKDLEAVETPDALTAVFRFAKPTPFQLIRNALPALTSVVPKHHLRRHRHRRQPGQQRAGRHRAVQVRRVQARRILPAASATPTTGARASRYLDEIVYRVLPDRAAAAGALEADEIQLAAFSAVPLADLERIAKVDGHRGRSPRATRR